MKIAFLFMLYDEHSNKKIISDYFSNNLDKCKIYSHFKEKKKKPKDEFLGKFQIDKHIQTAHSDINLVDCHLNLVEEALKEKENEWFVFLSGSCLPIKTFDNLYKFLETSQLSFFDTTCWPTLTPNKQHLNDWIGEWNANYLQYDFTKFVKHSQWCILNRVDAEILVSTKHKHLPAWEDLQNKFNRGFAKDEYYPLAVLNHEIKDYAYTEQMTTFVHWEAQSIKPRSFSLNQVSMIKDDTQSFFIRKVDNINGQIKILVVVPGTGNPNFEKKHESINNNFHLLEKTKPNNSIIDYEVISYDETYHYLKFDKTLNVNVKRNSGFIGEHIFKEVKPEKTNNYDFTLIVLDDIQLHNNFNLHDMIKLQLKYDIDIFSPSLTEDSEVNHPHMVTSKLNKGKLISQNQLEFFCYLFTTLKPNLKNSFTKWYRLFNEDTKWMWGLDRAIVNCLNLKCVMHNDIHMKHLYNGGSHCEDALIEYKDTQARLFEKFNTIVKMDRSSKEIIDLKNNYDINLEHRKC